MTSATRPAPTKAFYLPLAGGKYHRANPITSQALCRGTVLLDTTAMPLHVTLGAPRVHPMVCRLCLSAQHVAA